MKHPMRSLSGIALCGLLAACASPPAPNFYTLQNGQAGQAPSSQASLTPLYLANFSIPERVDRPQLVIRKSAEQVQILAQQLWAEPLKQALNRSLAAQLREQGFDLVSSREALAQLSVEVVNFEAWPGKEVLLEVQWQIKHPDGKVLLRRQMTWRETSIGTDSAALVAAHQRAWAQFAGALAQTLRTLPAS